MTSKKLYLLRHAKSSWSDFSLDDFDRPLNKRGKRDAPLMAARMGERAIDPEVIISSPAKRAKTTAKYFSKMLNTKVIYDENIYEASTLQLKEIINQAFEDHDTIMLVGHNPSLTMLSNSLCGYHIENIPTAGIVGVAFDNKDIARTKGTLLFFDYPKNS
ncbi:MAG: histidine phosphatase family protein [Campylobacterota bacterium]|nr:histidine phosphatase family protein [Campylobacterota bacterium]